MKKQFLSFLLTLFVILGCLCSCKNKHNSPSTDPSSDSSSLTSENSSDTTSGNTDSKDSSTNPNGEGDGEGDGEGGGEGEGEGDGEGDGEGIDQTDEPQIPDNSPTIYLEAEKKDGKVVLKVYARNNPGVASFKFKINYDKSAVSPEKIEKGLINVTSNLQQTTNLAGYVTAVYVNVNGTNESGTFFTVTFSPKADVKSAEFSISADNGNFVNVNNEPVNFKLKGTKIEF